MEGQPRQGDQRTSDSATRGGGVKEGRGTEGAAVEGGGRGWGCEQSQVLRTLGQAEVTGSWMGHGVGREPGQ